MGSRNRIATRALLASGLSLIFALPLWVMVSGSLRPLNAPPPRVPELLPWPPALDNYPAAYDLVNMAQQALNSLLVALATVPLGVLIASWAGFSLARLPERWSRPVLVASLVALLVPATGLLVGRFVIFNAAGLTNSYLPLVAPALIGTTPLSVLLFWWAFQRLPAEYFDAARIEGIGPLGAWWHIGLPLVRPVVVAAAVIGFAFSWSDVLGPLIYLYDSELFTLPLGLRSLAELSRADQPLFLAGAVSATLPVVVAFLVAQRFFLNDRSEGI